MGVSPNPATPPVGAAIPSMGTVETTSSLDMLLDDLFPNPELTPQPATTPAPAPVQSQPTSQPTAPAQGTTPPAASSSTTTSADFFLRTQTGTVYKTPDEAVRGTEQKDRLIEKLRQDYIREKGIDPITGKPASISVVTSPGANGQGTQSYATSDAFFDDLYHAVERGDKQAYRTTLGRFVAEVSTGVVQQVLQPLAPLVAEFSKTSATSKVSGEIANFAEFAKTPEYQDVLTEFPDLKTAIEAAESNPGLASRLPEYYKLAYRAAYGKTVPSMVRSQAPVSPAQPQGQPTTAPAIRPTTSGSSHPVGPTTDAPGEQRMDNTAGRKAIIAAWEAKYGRDSKI